MRLLLWDFDGTLGYRQGGLFGSATLELLCRNRPGLKTDIEQLRNAKYACPSLSDVKTIVTR
jgi:hypothetical protein